MRFSKSFIKTYKEVPKEAETVSHILMLRSSMIRQLTRGVYTYLPLGLKVIKKIENIVREELDKIGAQELLMPVLQPADLWQESKRWFSYGPELMRIKDRNGRDFTLGPTHEEVVVDIFRNMVSSHKELPLNLYQIQNKFRDERRPRFGLMRGREFIMKDGYSFHLSTDCLDREYNRVKEAYSNIFKRIGLDFRAVMADTGSIGGSESHEFMVLANSGEDDILYTDNSEYAANVEKATSIIDFKKSDEIELEKQLKETPNITSIEEVSEFLKVEKFKTLKSLLLKEILEDGSKRYVVAIIRGDLDINEIKVKNATNGIVEYELMNDDDINKLNLTKGYFSPLKDLKSLVDNNIYVIADESVKYLKNFVSGANLENYHYINTNLKDLHIDKFADIRIAKEGDLSPDSKGILKIAKGIEVGHIFKLGKKYSDAMNAKVLDKNGISNTVFMGCYGIGISRIAAAAIEQYNDENGIKWPLAIAPYHVDLILLNVKDEIATKLADNLYELLLNNNIDVIYDDRDEKAGFKFKDADLIGFPIKIIVGRDAKDDIVELKFRNSNESYKLHISEILEKIKLFLNN